MRLIDADALHQDWLENGLNEPVYDTNAFLYSIDAQPTIDAVPVKHGRWVQARYTQAPLYICSECDRREYKQHRYCPQCGAKMDGDSECD